jgi:hypothetical protein
MLPALIVVDICVFFYYLKKGVIISKCKATINILNNFKRINERYKKIQNERTVSDEKLIETFEDHIMIPKIMDSQKNDLFANFIMNLSKFTRRFL